ncbi:MAG TPA: metal-sensitive transcriptional regulator [Candidatus Mcinerneyibacteriales bacterium]|nr:metal-sensitive transcriptional regulator [Candidatus Mcinerneyibacteriales bacterium]HPE19883.1 metal-sensitive transcriptional regulator [Candidatus Mcinerneyibacteriales bacterium]HPJ69597.1 metal-sensitive transcriptional regulator [Candidatus Mcinerneyibacteriales bacterium]HPQ90163.1 metal-sensitive transcriptional regulator [Candidatus Mcinerneyibacteriales bacterium]
MANKKCCTPVKAHHSNELKIKMINRLNKIEGQVRGIRRMIDKDVYCDEILNQFLSVEAALNGVKKILLEAHLKSCVVEQIRAGRDEVIDEVLVTVKKMLK